MSLQTALEDLVFARRVTRTSGAQSPVARPNHQYEEMAEDWVVIHDLLASTAGMRRADERNLPKFAKESKQDYQKRRDTSFLFQFFEDAVDYLVALPFAKPIGFTDEPPDWMLPVMRNMDLQGSDYQSQMMDWFWDGVVYGLGHVLVDHTDTALEEADTGRPRMVFEMERLGQRAVIRRISPANLIGWRARTERNGATTLTQARIYERRWSEEDDFSEVREEVITVWTPATVEEHVRGPRDQNFTPQGPQPNRLGRIPLHTCYTKRSGFLTARPPLLECAWLNVDHWQSYSDQRQILHTGRVPILFQTGVSDDEKKDRTTIIGGKRSVRTSKSKTDASMGYVEPEGAAMEHGEKHLEMVSERCRVKGSSPTRSLGPVTATGEILSQSRASADVQRWAEAYEAESLDVWTTAAEWDGQATMIPEGWRPVISTDFDVRERTPENMAIIQADRSRGDITKRTYLTEAIRHGIYDSDLDVQQEIDDTGGEQAPMAFPEPVPVEEGEGDENPEAE